MARSRFLRKANRFMRGENVAESADSAGATLRASNRLQRLAQRGNELVDHGGREGQRRLEAQHITVPARDGDQHACLVQEIFHLRHLDLAEDLAGLRVLDELDATE